MSEKLKHILTTDGELYHAGRNWVKRDVKYISRVWKNGRWRYTYPEIESSVQRAKSTIDKAYASNKRKVDKATVLADKYVRDKTGLTALKKYKKASSAVQYTTGHANKVAQAKKSAAQKELMNTPVGKLKNGTSKVKRGVAKVQVWLGVN